MTSRFFSPGLALLGLFVLASAPGRAGTLSAARLDLLDQRGYFTPGFKKAAQDLVNARQAIVQAKLDEKKSRALLPPLRDQYAAAEAQVAALRQELARYEHPEDADFEALQGAMKDPAVTPADKLVLAQAFVWSYPSDPHQAEAEQDLRQLQAQIASQLQAVQDAAAARAAAQEKLVERAKARQLSLAEWQVFLLDKSQEELITYLGHPQSQGDGYWIYTIACTTDPQTQAKAGLQINFNGTRVISVAAAPYQP
jgi:hypothetical protein